MGSTPGNSDQIPTISLHGASAPIFNARVLAPHKLNWRRKSQARPNRANEGQNIKPRVGRMSAWQTSRAGSMTTVVILR